MRLLVLFTHVVSARSSQAANDDASMMHWDMEEGFAEFEDENLMQFSGGASTEYPSLDEQESVKEARAMDMIKDPCNDPVACGGSDEHAFWQRSKEVEDDEHSLWQQTDEQTFFQYDEPNLLEPMDDLHLNAHSRIFGELLDDSFDTWDESSMVQQGQLDPCNDEQSLWQQTDEQTFFQYDEPNLLEPMDDLHLNAHSRIFGELLDDSFDTWDESSMVQQGIPEPCHDEQSLWQQTDEQTFFQYDEPNLLEPMDDLHLNAHSRIFGELLDDSFDTWDESSMVQQGRPAPCHDEQSLWQQTDEQTFFQYDEPNLLEPMDDLHLNAHSRIFGELLDDSFDTWDESSMVQHGRSEPCHDEQSLWQQTDEQTFFQYDEPNLLEPMDDLHLNAHSRIFGELLDDSFDTWDESSMVQQGIPEPCHDEQSLWQQTDEQTLFQYDEPSRLETMDHLHLNAHSRVFGELLDDSMEAWDLLDESSMFQDGLPEPIDDSSDENDEYSMFQQGQSAAHHDEQSFYQHDEAETLDDALEEEAAVEDYILMQYEGSAYPGLQEQSSVLEARSETLHKGDPNRFFQNEEL